MKNHQIAFRLAPAYEKKLDAVEQLLRRQELIRYASLSPNILCKRLVEEALDRLLEGQERDE